MRGDVRCTRRNGAGDKLMLSGNVDGSSAVDVERAVASQMDGQGRRLRLDISGLAFIDSTGAQAILHVHNAIEAYGRRVVFEKPQHEVRRVLHLLGLDQVLDVSP